MKNWNEYGYDYLCDILSDYHKDVFGYRLRMYGEPKEAVIAELEKLDAYLEKMKSTEEGLEELRASGFVV